MELLVTSIKDLARSLGMAVSTVSRALNDSPEASEATKLKVREAARALGYVPNQSGRSLRTGSTGTVGFMIQTGPDITGQGDGFLMQVSDGLQAVLSSHNLDLVALFCNSGQHPVDYLRRMVTKSFVDAVIISYTTRTDDRISLLAERGIPFVTLGRSLSDAGQPWLDPDFEGFARDAVGRLWERGYRNIGILLPDDAINTSFLIQAAIEAELLRRGHVLDPRYIYRGKPTEQSGYQIGSFVALSGIRPDAVILSSEYHAPGFYRGLEDNGLQPGADIAVIGFESSCSRFLAPRLTAFRQDGHAIGEELGRALLAQIPAHAKTYAGAGRKTWPLSLVDGDSDPDTRKLVTTNT